MAKPKFTPKGLVELPVPVPEAPPPVPIVEPEALPQGKPLLAYDGSEYWVVYPEDNPYRLLAGLPQREVTERYAIVDIEPGLLTQVRGWWYTTAATKVETLVASAEVDWDACRLTDAEIDNGDTTLYTRKLNRIAGHLVWVSTQLVRTEAVLEAAREAVDHACTRQLALEENGKVARLKGSQAQRLALFISPNPTMRRAKVENIELAAQRTALAHLREALDILWRTTSRAISARAAEPLER